MTYYQEPKLLRISCKGDAVQTEKVVQLWLSVDPLSDEYPSTSPYMYVLGNPIIFVDPNGMNHTKYEDSNGNLLAETNDGNDATVIISDENKESFQQEFKYASQAKQQDSEMYNKSWIKRYGDGMSVNSGDFVTDWALDAINSETSKEIAGSDNAIREGDGFRISPIGPALIILGQRLVPKNGGVGGGGRAGNLTSAASKSLRWTDRTIQSFFKTNAKLPAKGFLHRALGTRGIGAALGRVVPYVGWGWLAIDIGYGASKYYGPSKWYGDDNTKWFR